MTTITAHLEQDLVQLIEETHPELSSMGRDMLQATVIAILEEQIEIRPTPIAEMNYVYGYLAEAQTLASTFKKK